MERRSKPSSEIVPSLDSIRQVPSPVLKRTCGERCGQGELVEIGYFDALKGGKDVEVIS
jgi:hypothetical protein